MTKFIQTSILLALITLTQAASSQWTGQFDQIASDSAQADAIRPRPPREPNPPRYPDRLTWVSAGEARTNKIINNEFTFRPRSNRPAYGLRLVGTGSGVLIRSVVVYFRNGDSYDLREMEGRLREGQRLAIRLNGRRITEVRVVATTESLVGARGRFRVDIAY